MHSPTYSANYSNQNYPSECPIPGSTSAEVISRNMQLQREQAMLYGVSNSLGVNAYGMPAAVYPAGQPASHYLPAARADLTQKFHAAKITPSRIEHNVDVAMGYGDMPSSMLMAKFEETDMGPDEDQYENYARGTLVDRRPDEATFEHERPRGAVNARAGRIQLQYEGHRGSAVPWAPELFLGFGGDEDRDPRGNNVDPDMKQLVKQEQARMRFIRFSADQCDQVTGGMRSEYKVMADKQKIDRLVRDRLKIFNRQLDGRREGLRRVFKHKSNVAKQVLIQSYGDFIKDYALNPQRRANIVCDKMLRDTKEYRAETSDQDYTIAKYAQARKTTMGRKQRLLNGEITDAEFAQSDNSKNFKALGLVMSNLVRLKHQAHAEKTDISFSEGKNTVDYKSAPMVRDLALILRGLARDQDFSSGDATMLMKTAHRPQLEHQARLVVYNHLKPAHHYLSAEIMYKSVKPGADTRKIKDMVERDAHAAQEQDETQGRKRDHRLAKSGMKLKRVDDGEYGEEDKTVSYKKLMAPQEVARRRQANGENFSQESDNTQVRRPTHLLHRNPNKEDISAVGINFANNTSKERLTAPMGTKYMRKFHDRDNREGEVESLSKD